MHRAVLAWDRGETECGDEDYDKALYMLWASRIMCDTPIEGDASPGCTDIATAEEWARHADCLCDACGCPEPVTDCTITPDYTADFVVEELPEDPEPGTYLVTGNGTIVVVTDDPDDPDGLNETLNYPIQY